MQSLASLEPSFVIPGEQGGFDAVAVQAHPDVERIIHVHHAGIRSASSTARPRCSWARARRPKARPQATCARAPWPDGSEPAIMLTGPIDVTKKVLARSHMS